MAENILMIPDKRISAAKGIILRLTAGLDTTNTYGIAGFGAFWSREIKRNPSDIDLAVYVLNDAVFNSHDKQFIFDPLKKTFGLDPELHIITPYTTMVTHEAHNYKIMLSDRVPIWGNMPSWL